MRRHTERFVLLAVLLVGGCGEETSRQPFDTDAPDAGDADATDTGGDTGGDTADDVSDAETDIDTGPMAHDEALARLGVELEVGPRLDPDGRAVRENYNPFGRDRRYLHRLSETYLAGLTPVPDRRQALFDDASGTHQFLYSDDADDAWALLPKSATVGDVDGDGRDEIVLVVLNNNSASADHRRLYLRVIDDAAEAFAVDEVELTVFGDLAAFVAPWGWFAIDVATGDVDGDNRDELMATGLGNLWVVDDQVDGYTPLHSQAFPPTAGLSQYVRVAAGDTDADGIDEVIAIDGQIAGNTGTATWHLYNESFDEEAGGPVQASIEATTYLLATADASVADVDGDGLNEVVFGGHRSGANDSHILVMDDAMAGYAFLPKRYALGWNYPIVRVETGDFDGDGVHEIVAYRDIIDDLRHASNGTLVRQSQLPHDVYYSHAIAVGDVTNDWRDDILYINGGTSDPWMLCWGTNSAGVYEMAWQQNVIGAGNYPVIATPNVDGDSALVEFEDHEVLFTAPLVLAVLQAPPSYADVPMDMGNVGTSFGRGSSTGVEAERSMGFTTGFTIGTEFEDRLFTQSKARFTVTVETAMDWTASTARVVEKAFFYNGTGETDKVVFSTIPFDVYYFRVLSSPVPEEVDSTMVVNLPREPQVLFVDRAFFNANNGDFPDIDDRVLTHTIGDPGTYPTEASINFGSLVAQGGAYSDTMTVGQGAGSETLEITISDEVGHGTSFDMSVTVESEVGAGGFIFGASAGFHYGFGYRITSTSSTMYSGTVGNILDPEDWAANQFDFGLLVRPTSFAGQRFPLIGYWVN